MGLFNKIQCQKSEINYDIVDCNETPRNICQFLAFAQFKAEKQNRFMYYKKEVADAITAVNK